MAGTEFTSDFDTNMILLGAEDYTFSIFYEPLDELSDSLSFLIESNGGDIVFHIWRTGKMLVIVMNKIFNKEKFVEPGGYGQVLKIAYPLIILSASHTIMQFVDRQFLAFNSTEDVAAALPGGILYFTMFCFFMVTINFTSALVAQFFGAKDNQSVKRTIDTIFIFIFWASIVLTFIGFFLSSYIFKPY